MRGLTYESVGCEDRPLPAHRGTQERPEQGLWNVGKTGEDDTIRDYILYLLLHEDGLTFTPCNYTLLYRLSSDDDTVNWLLIFTGEVSFICCPSTVGQAKLGGVQAREYHVRTPRLEEGLFLSSFIFCPPPASPSNTDHLSPLP